MFAYADGPRSAARRRGIVLVLILGMLGLMALIGVTFATFAGQSLRSGRNASQGAARPQGEALMDFALAQLINDTNNPLSAIRGHSLLRDMYGNDSVFRGSNPVSNTAAEFGGVLAQVQTVAGTFPLQFTGFADAPSNSLASPSGGFHSTANVTPFGDKLQYVTNIPTTGQYYGLDFTRWVVRFPGGPNPNAQLNDGTPSQFATQTFEVLEDDATTGVHLFTLSAALGRPSIDPAFNNKASNAGNQPPIHTSSDYRSYIYNDPNIGSNYENSRTYNQPTPGYFKNFSTFTREFNGNTDGTIRNMTPATPQQPTVPSPAFVLDGRYMRAFNGPGATAPVPAVYTTDGSGKVTYYNYPFNQAAYGNMRIAGFNPDSIGLDEDYDACDLENWFLALQSADGQVMIPSFHRPGILSAVDWTLPSKDSNGNIISTYATSRAKILRPRVVDNSPVFPPDPSSPDPTTGKLTYDVDNDGDGVTDSVWLDLGYPVQQDPNGRLFKPLFAFMVIGLNGRLPLNTVGNLQGRATGTSSATITQLYNANVAYNSTSYPAQFGSNGIAADADLASTGMIPYPGLYSSPTGQHQTAFSSQVYFDAPLYDHTSHLGYSVNEINPKYALQNAPSNLYPNAAGGKSYAEVGTTYDPINYVINQNYAQYDDANVPVALTQLRNLLAGTRPTDAPNPYPSSATNTLPPVGYLNNDANVVAVNGKAYVLPNNMADGSDYNPTSSSAIVRNTPPVVGRWGEPIGIPQLVPFASDSSVSAYQDGTYPSLVYANFSRAGQSISGGGTFDTMDDDFDATDPHLPSAIQAGQYTIDSTNSNTSSVVLQNGAWLHTLDIPGGNFPDPTGYKGSSFYRAYPEDVDSFDGLAQRGNATERARLFVTPQDTAGVGRTVAFFPTANRLAVGDNIDPIRPFGDFDYGLGSDHRGRVGYFRYFRPAGLPQQVVYPNLDPNFNFPIPTYFRVLPADDNALGKAGDRVQYHVATQQYLMPLIMPAGQVAATASAMDKSKSNKDIFYDRVPTPEVSNNRTHGLQAAMTPQITGGAAPSQLTAQQIASLAATPFDFVPYLFIAGSSGSGVPGGYNNAVVDFNKSGSGPSTAGAKLLLSSPTINPYDNAHLLTNVNTRNGPNLGAVGDPAVGTYPLPFGSAYTNGVTVQDKDGNAVSGVSLDQPGAGAAVVNGYINGSLNKDEADEQNLFNPSGLYDSPYVNADLEWLYRKHDVDGASLNSRLAQLAPVSFLNPADGLTRRRLFSVDSWDLISFAYANDNPKPYAGNLGGYGIHSSDHDFSYNSRFSSQTSPSFELMNQVTTASTTTANGTSVSPLRVFGPANGITTEFLPNPTIFSGGQGTIAGSYLPLASGTANTSYPAAPYPATAGSFAANTQKTYNWPHAVNMAANTNDIFGNADINAQADPYTSLIVPAGALSLPQVQTPSLAHRDRRINLNFPLPISHDPAEPIRQKWCRETYQFLKAILPPAAVDTPEELAQLSQFVVNIVDFRDTDNAMTRFVNTDLVVTDALTKTASTTQNAAFDPTWTVSPAGVRFADPINNAADVITTFPFDSSLYSPDTDPTCHFLVQHGMEYCPIAINEAMAYSAQYGKKADTSLTAYQAMFIELVNTLTEAQDNPGTAQNASAINLEGWDIVIAPDACGWGRPDPISGEVNPLIAPVFDAVPTDPTPGNSVPTYTDAAGSDWKNKNPDDNWKAVVRTTSRFTIPPNGTEMNGSTTDKKGNTYLKALVGDQGDKFVIGDYRTGYTPGDRKTTQSAGTPVDKSTDVESSPVADTSKTPSEIDLRFPVGKSTDTTYAMPDFNLPGMPQGVTNKGLYYWVYLRRPANPFEVTKPTRGNPNREMVTVDCIRMPVIDSSGASLTNGSLSGTPKNIIYSAGRLQPYRGGHLVAPNTDPTVPYSTTQPLTDYPTSGAANGVKKICPPSPPYAYGYSEQMQAPPTGNGYAVGGPSSSQITPTIQQSINNTNPNSDRSWSHFPFFDRDFNNVAELLLVPCCPPGLFTKQFVEEPYPGNVINTVNTPNTPATGTDNGNGAFTYTTTPLKADPTATQAGAKVTPEGAQKGTDGMSNIVPPRSARDNANSDPTLVGRQDFGFGLYGLNDPTNNKNPNGTILNPNGTLPSSPTFPYLTDNFYYTAASVGLPNPFPTNNDISASYTQLTTEIGGWTGAGWHKMLEFFEVPSSANGATGFAANGDNYDWYRADLKPGLLNLNLIIDDEVFAGLVDDPRLNETLAGYEVISTTTGGLFSVNPDSRSYIPYVVSQIDASTNLPTGAYPMFSALSYNSDPSLAIPGEVVTDATGSTRLQAAPEAGRGYSYRENNLLYNNNHSANPQTASAQTLVTGLKAAFSDFLKLRSGGSGYLFAHGAGDVGMGEFTPAGEAPLTLGYPSAVAADRPFRSLSYPDINYTIMRPASLPPTPPNTTPTGTYPFASAGTDSPLPFGLGQMYTYGADSKGDVPYVQLVAGTAPGTVPNLSDGTTFSGIAPMNQATPYQYAQDPGIKNPFLPVQYVNTATPTAAQPNVASGDPPLSKRRLAPPYEARVTIPASGASQTVLPVAAPFPAPIPPTPLRRLFQIPDHGNNVASYVPTGGNSNPPFTPSNASIYPSYNPTAAVQKYAVNMPTIARQLTTGTAAYYAKTLLNALTVLSPAPALISNYDHIPPTLFLHARAGFAPDNRTTQRPDTYNNFLGDLPIFNFLPWTTDQRQHPLYRTELLQKVSNLTTVRTHQFAVWITIGFFEVVKAGTPELGIPDVLGAEFGSAGDRQRFRSFFVIDRTKATGFNPYYPGNFRDCVTYRSRIEN